MMLLRQVKKDICNQLGWVLFYEVVATIILMTVILSAISFSFALNKSKILHEYIDRNVIYLQEKTVQMERNDSVNSGFASPEIVDYLQSAFSASGKAGSFVTFSNSDTSINDYDNVILLFGQYVDLCGFDMANEMEAYISYSKKELVGNVINVNGTDLTIEETAPKDIAIFHPLFVIESKNPMLENTLFLCFRDYKQAIALYNGTSQLSGDRVLDRYILVDPDLDDIYGFQEVMYSNTGTIYTGISVDDYIKTSSDPQLKSERLFLSYYILTGIMLAAIMVFNIIRMINANIHEYVIHHIYGAPILLIKQRVVLFVLFLHILPLAGALYILYVNMFLKWYIYPLLIICIAGLCALCAWYAEKKTNTLRGLDILRRDY